MKGTNETASPGPDMLLDRVDENDDVVGTVRRRDVFDEKAGFRVAHVLISDDKGRLLLQRLARIRERHPGMWGASVAAYLFAGEGYEEAARRRERLYLHRAHAVLADIDQGLGFRYIWSRV